VCGPDGIAIFNALHRRGTVTAAMLFAFDLLELDGVDYRPLPLGKREERLAHLVDRRLVGIVMNERHRVGVEAPVKAVPIGSGRALAQGQEPGQPSHDRGSRAFRGVGQ
jgi:ATP-dependent DNA ligase